MTKHRKHSQTIKALQKQSEINLSGNYLREKSLIDSLSCKIEEKFSLTFKKEGSNWVYSDHKKIQN